MNAQKWIAVALLGGCSNDTPTPVLTPPTAARSTSLTSGGHRSDLTPNGSFRFGDFDCHRTTDREPVGPAGANFSRADWHTTLRGRASGEVYAIAYAYWIFIDDGINVRELERCFRVISISEKHASYRFEAKGSGPSILKSVIAEDVVLDIDVSTGEAAEKIAIARTGWHFTFHHGQAGYVDSLVTPLTGDGITPRNGANPALDGAFVPAIPEVGIDSIEVPVTTE